MSPRLSRREFLAATAVAGGALLLPRAALPAAESYELPGETRRALEESPLVYISPLRSDGSESTCHGEVWFATDQGDVLVCTGSERWKAEAVRKGLGRARLWVGDFGVWKRSGGRFTTGPSFLAEASFEREASAIERVLGTFGQKYADEWDTWGPRFRNGLADGSRVLIRYRPASA